MNSGYTQPKEMCSSHLPRFETIKRTQHLCPIAYEPARHGYR